MMKEKFFIVILGLQGDKRMGKTCAPKMLCFLRHPSTQYSMLHGLLDPLLLQREMVFSLSRIERKDPKFFSCYANISWVREIFNSFSA